LWNRETFRPFTRSFDLMLCVASQSFFLRFGAFAVTGTRMALVLPDRRLHTHAIHSSTQVLPSVEFCLPKNAHFQLFIGIVQDSLSDVL